MAPRSTTSALDRLLDPVGRCLNPEVARALLALRTDEETQARIDELADQCRRRTASLTRESTFR